MIARTNHITLLGYFFVFLVLLVALMTVLPRTYAPYAPTLDQVKYRQHAVERHGKSAVTARRWVKACDNVQAYYCTPTSKHPFPRYILVCAKPPLCGGVIVNSMGVEITAWVAPCTRWNQLVQGCAITEARKN